MTLPFMMHLVLVLILTVWSLPSSCNAFNVGTTITVSPSSSDLLLDTKTRQLRRIKRLQKNNDNVVSNKPTRISSPHHDDDDDAYHTSSSLQTTPPQKERIKNDNYHDDDMTQLRSIQSTSPAILLQSGPGTGKSHVLSRRIAHLLLQEGKSTTPSQNIIVLSFTKRNAVQITNRALDILYGKEEEKKKNVKIWSGTIHSFALAILHRYDAEDKIRVISTKEVKSRVQRCLQRYQHSPQSMQLYAKALSDSHQSLSKLIVHMVRCTELWKEANLVPPSFLYSIVEMKESENEEEKVKQDCVELAMRLGIPESVALLSLDIFPDYQKIHATTGTADPSDLSLLAHNLLSSNKHALHHMRHKLHHVILDEYQDVSVSQHALLRLVIRGLVNDHDNHGGYTQEEEEELITYDTPKLFCAGDINQSIYGWRGASPSLTVSNFLKDYPMGVVVPLNTCYRLPRHLMDAANLLLLGGGGGKRKKDGEGENEVVMVQRNVKMFQKSPAGIKSASKIVQNVHDESSSSSSSSSSSLLGKQVLSSLEKKMEEKYNRQQQQQHAHVRHNKNKINGNSIIFIQGLWDAREEAKYIASSIRRQFKERLRLYVTTTADAENKNIKQKDYQQLGKSFFDPTDVAIMVRSTSSSQMKLLEEALGAIGIPYQIVDGHDDDDDTLSISPRQNAPSSTATSTTTSTSHFPIKPIKLMTMHRAKGDEFDEVYLPGWNEHTFPHPASVSNNRLQEERRLAYVALTRARQRVVITYCFVRKVLYKGAGANVGAGMKRKYVTEQVEPSRFLYELMPAGKKKSSSSPPGTDKTTWSHNTGFKEIIAGKNLPSHFAKSYRTPVGYEEENAYKSVSVPSSSFRHAEELYESYSSKSRRRRSGNHDCDGSIYQKYSSLTEADDDAHYLQDDKLMSHSNYMENIYDITVNTNQRQSSLQTTVDRKISNKKDQQHLDMIQSALKEIVVYRTKGCCRTYKKKFRGMLRDVFEIERGTALVLSNKKELKNLAAVDILFQVSTDALSKRPLSQCTAMQLGHYLAYLILKKG